MIAVAPEVFQTPGGHSALFAIRPGTTDWNTVAACCTEDEYSLPRRLRGWALDVGAHVGGVTVALLMDNPDLSVIALEALTENVEVLRHNVELNGLSGRFLHLPGPASRDHEPMTVFYGRTDEAFAREHRYIGNADWQTDVEKVTAPGVTLSDVVAKVGPLCLMKIDCEGGEWGFLDSPAIGAVREIVGEFHPRDGNGPPRLRELLEPTHHVAVDDSLPFGPFRAVRRG